MQAAMGEYLGADVSQNISPNLSAPSDAPKVAAAPVSHLVRAPTPATPNSTDASDLKMALQRLQAECPQATVDSPGDSKYTLPPIQTNAPLEDLLGECSELSNAALTTPESWLPEWAGVSGQLSPRSRVGVPCSPAAAHDAQRSRSPRSLQGQSPRADADVATAVLQPVRSPAHQSPATREPMAMAGQSEGARIAAAQAQRALGLADQQLEGPWPEALAVEQRLASVERVLQFAAQEHSAAARALLGGRATSPAPSATPVPTASAGADLATEVLSRAASPAPSTSAAAALAAEVLARPLTPGTGSPNHHRDVRPWGTENTTPVSTVAAAARVSESCASSVTLSATFRPGPRCARIDRGGDSHRRDNAVTGVATPLVDGLRCVAHTLGTEGAGSSDPVEVTGAEGGRSMTRVPEACPQPVTAGVLPRLSHDWSEVDARVARLLSSSPQGV